MHPIKHLSQLQSIHGLLVILLFLVFISAILAIGSFMRHQYYAIRQKTESDNPVERLFTSLIITALSSVISYFTCYGLLLLLIEINS